MQVESTDGELLLPPRTIYAPRTGSMVVHEPWYRDAWGTLPAVDLQSDGTDGFGTPNPIESSRVEGNTVVLDGPRGITSLWIPPWNGCLYSDIAWRDADHR